MNSLAIGAALAIIAAGYTYLTSDGTDWDAINPDDGMPVHCRMGLTANNEGPADPPDPAFDHWGCWCIDPTCPGPPE